jgi:hypothetical protein
LWGFNVFNIFYNIVKNNLKNLIQKNKICKFKIKFFLKKSQNQKSFSKAFIHDFDYALTNFYFISYKLVTQRLLRIFIYTTYTKARNTLTPEHTKASCEEKSIKKTLLFLLPPSSTQLNSRHTKFFPPF